MGSRCGRKARPDSSRGMCKQHDPEMALTRWPAVLLIAAAIVQSYATGVTLRQLFYEPGQPSAHRKHRRRLQPVEQLTAEARREGSFPDLVDQTRDIWELEQYEDPAAAMRQWTRRFAGQRTAGQEVALWVGVEKAGLLTQLGQWVGHLGVPVVALRGYSSQSFVDQIVDRAQRQRKDGLRVVLLYLGDLDSSGEDIERVFLVRSVDEDQRSSWDVVQRVALTEDQVVQHQLPRNPGKMSDPAPTCS